MKMIRKNTALDALPEVQVVYKIRYPNGIIKVGRTKNLKKRMTQYQWEDLIREKFEYIELVSYDQTNDPINDELNLIREMNKTHALAHGKEWFVDII